MYIVKLYHELFLNKNQDKKLMSTVHNLFIKYVIASLRMQLIKSLMYTGVLGVSDLVVFVSRLIFCESYQGAEYDQLLRTD